MAAITAPEYPGERLILGSSPRTCRNPLLAAERARKRDELLAATERDLARIAARLARRRRPLHGWAQIGLAVGGVIDRYKMAKHFTLTITEANFAFARTVRSPSRSPACRRNCGRPSHRDGRPHS